MLVRFERVDASRPRGASSARRMRKSIEELVSRSASRLCTPTKRPKSCLQLMSPRARNLQLLTLRLRPPSFLLFNNSQYFCERMQRGLRKNAQRTVVGPQYHTNTVLPATNLIEAFLGTGSRTGAPLDCKNPETGCELNTMLKPHKEQLDCGGQCF